MLVPIFVSCPTDLNSEQEAARRLIYGELGRFGLEARTIGRTDYPTSLPLREVLQLARRCAGGLVLGFCQFRASKGTWREGTPREASVKGSSAESFPTPWNQLECGILFALGLPQLVFREDGVVGGVFDIGAMDVFLHRMPMGKLKASERKAVREILQKWSAQVQTHYYNH